MEKLYNVVVNKGVDLEQLDKELAASTGDSPIPNRPVSLANPLVGNNRTTQWLLTDEEAEELSKDSRVKAVQTPQDEYLHIIGSGSQNRGDILRVGEVDWQNTNNDLDEHGLVGLIEADRLQNGLDSRIVNWGIGRHQNHKDENLKLSTERFVSDGTGSFKKLGNPFGAAYSGEKIITGSYGSTYDYDYDGEGVDIVVIDSGVNKNNSEWDDANGVSRFQAIDWVQVAEDNGYNLTDANGDPLVQHEKFYEDIDGHGTCCASLAAGKVHGFAKGAHVFGLKATNIGVPYEQENHGFTLLECLTLVKIWHEAKMAEGGNKRPTVLNLSLGFGTTGNLPDIFDWRGDTYYRYPVSYRDLVIDGQIVYGEDGNPVQQPYIDPADRTSQNLQITDAEMLEKYGYRCHTQQYSYSSALIGLNIQDYATDAICEDLTDAGVHICVASGNENVNIDIDKDDDRWTVRSNYFNTDEQGLDWDNATFYEQADQSYNAYYHRRPASPAADNPYVFRVGSLSNSKFANPDYNFSNTKGWLTSSASTTDADYMHHYMDENGGLHFNPTAVSNPNEVKSQFSNCGNAVNIWAAGEETNAGNAFQVNFDKGLNVLAAAQNKKQYLSTSPMFTGDWTRYIHRHVLDGDMTRGFDLEYDDTTRPDRLRVLIRLNQDYIDELRSKGIDEIISLRTFFHFDGNDPDFSGFKTATAVNERNSDGSINTNAEYTTFGNFGGSQASQNFFGINAKYSITSHDVDFAEEVYEYGAGTSWRSSGTTMSRISVDGTALETVDKTASFYKTRVEDDCIYIQTAYIDYDDTINGQKAVPQTGVNLDLTDPNLSDRVLFEINLPLDEFTNQPENYEGMFRCGGTVANMLHSAQVSHITDYQSGYALEDAVAPYYNIGMNIHYQGEADQVYSGTSMAAPMVAGMLATHLEKHGNMTPAQAIELMCPNDSRLGKPSVAEAEEIGYRLNNYSQYIVPIDGEPSAQSTQNRNWQRFYNSDEWNSFRDPYNPTNRMVTSSKNVARVAKDDQVVANGEALRVKGNYKIYNGSYEDYSTVDITTDFTRSVPASINVGESPLGSLDVLGYPYTGATAAERASDATWAAKEIKLVGDLSLTSTPLVNGSLDIGSSTEFDYFKGLFEGRFTYTNDDAHPTLVQQSHAEATIDGETVVNTSQTENFLPKLPTISNASTQVNLPEDTALNTVVFIPQTTQATYTTYIDFDSATHGNAFAVVNNEVVLNKALDAELATDRNIQLEVWIEDIYGRESNRVTVTVTATDVNEHPPTYLPVTSVSAMNPNATAQDVQDFGTTNSGVPRILLREHNPEEYGLIHFTFGDPDYSQDQDAITTTLELVAHDGTVYTSAEDIYPFVYDADNKKLSVVENGFSLEHLDADKISQAPHAYNSFLIRITGSDGTLSTTQEHYIEITNSAADNAVLFTGGTSLVTLNLDENTPVGTVLINVEDYINQNNDAPYVYQVVGNSMYSNPNNYPMHNVIVEDNGDVKLNAALDFETNENVKFNIAVYNKYEANWQDHPNMTPSVFSVDINVGDVLDTPPKFTSPAHNPITYNVQEHYEPINNVYISVDADYPCTWSKTITITSGVADLPEGVESYFVLHNRDTGLPLGVDEEATRIDVVYATEQFPDHEGSEFIDIDSSTGDYIVNTLAGSAFSLELHATNAFGTSTQTVNTASVSNSPTFNDAFNLTNSTNININDGTASGTTIMTLAANRPLEQDDNGEYFDIVPQVGQSVQAAASGATYPAINDDVIGLNIDRTTGVITLNGDADLATIPTYKFFVRYKTTELMVTRVEEITINVISTSLLNLTMTTGRFSYYGYYYGFTAGYYSFGTLGGLGVGQKPTIQSVFPSITNPQVSYLDHYSGQVRFYVQGSGSVSPDTDNTWSEMVVTGISHSGSGTFIRANVAQKFVYSNAVQYRWNFPASPPFGTTTLVNDPSVTTNIEWK